MYVITATATLSNCQVFSNTVLGGGGGVSLVGSASTLQGNSITSNTATSDFVADLAEGGGLYLYESNATLNGNTIRANTADGDGGGLCLDTGSATLSGNTIAANTAAGGGGVNLSGSNATLSGNVIISNTSETGGGLRIGDSDVTLTNNVVAGNQVSRRSSAIETADSLVRLLQTTIARNTGGDGVGMSVHQEYTSSTVAMTNTILVSHTVGISVTSGNTLTVNAILWDTNTPITISQGVTAVVSVQNQAVGNPAFAADGYHLTSGSAAIDKGVNAGVAADIDGESRPIGAGYDLGADEFHDEPIAGLSATSDSPTLLGQTTRLTATITAGTNVAYAWGFGDGTTGSGVEVTHTYPAVGIYTAIVTASNPVSVLTKTTTVTITGTPIAGLAAVNDSPTEFGDATTLTATVTAGSNVAYTWAFGDGALGNGAVVAHTYSAVGIHTAIVTASNSVSTFTAMTTVTIYRTCWARLNDSQTDYATVQAAVDASAQAADVVKVSGYCTTVQNRSAYYEQVYLTKMLTIRGGYSPDFSVWNPDVYPTTLDAKGQGTGVYVSIGTALTPTLEALRLTNGSGSSGGGIWVGSSGSIVISGCEVYSNTGANGGGIAVYLGDSGSATLIGNRIYNNSGGYGAGVYLNGGRGSTLTGNQIYGHNGVGIYLASIRNTVLTENGVSSNNEGVHVSSSNDVSFATNQFYSNTLVGIYSDNSDTVTLTSNTIGSNGGGVSFMDSSDAVLADNHISGNAGGGVGFSNSPGAALTGNDISDNASYGISLSSSPTATLTGNTLSGSGITCLDSPAAILTGNTISRSTSYMGGGISLYVCHDATLAGNVVSSNTVTHYDGGGIYVASSDNAVLTNNTLYGNTASYGGGLAIVYGNNALLAGNKVYHNTATSEGAGIALDGTANATLVNNVVTENHGGTGAGISLACTPNARFLHNTLARNTGGQGVYARDGTTVYMTNTILVSHTIGIAATSDSTATLIATLWGSGAWANGSDTIGSSIFTGAVNVWGDPAFVNPGSGDYHIGPGSAAIDAGVDAGVTSDLDGQPRPIGAGYDIGADESMFTAPIAPSTGGTLVYSDTQGLPTTIQVPSGAVTELISLAFAPVPTVTAPAGFAFAGHAFGLEAYQGSTLLPGYVFLQPVIVTLHYSDADVAGLDEMLLRLEYWDGSAWVDAACGAYDRHPSENWLAVPVCHLSQFALFEVEYRIYLPLVMRAYP